jgi:hypothetical protein
MRRKSNIIEVYCDESRPELLSNNLNRNQDRYMVIGSIWIPGTIRVDLKNKIKELQNKHQVYGEIKWNNVSPSKIEFYQELIRLFFDTEQLRFRCIVVDSHAVDLKRYHDSDSELGFYKFYYQMLTHWINEHKYFWIYVDYKKNKVPDRIKTLQNVLWNSSRKGTVEIVQAINSKQSLMIQLADVLIGIVGYKYNSYKTSESKLSLIDIVEEEYNYKIQGTSRGSSKFNVFEIQLGQNLGWR